MDAVEPDRPTQGARAAAGMHRLAELAGDGPPTSIAEVVDRLQTLLEEAARTSPLGGNDGIASFTRLYRTITERIGAMVASGQFRSSPFLVRLDLEFAERYFRALRRYAADARTAPGVWRVLFDNRSDPQVAPVNFAVLGVNAHINYDLAHALVATWRAVPPDGEAASQHHDYGLINDVFAVEMDGLREELGSLLSNGPDGAPWDVGANWLSDLVVTFTRDLAWIEATRVWSQGATPEVCAESEARLDAIATFIGQGVLRAPLPF